MLRAEVVDGRPDQQPLGVLDVTVRRNGYGRQRESFEARRSTSRGLAGGPFPGVFIRAPVVERVGPAVEVLAEHDGVAGARAPGRVLFASFHPELAGDLRLHQLFLERGELMSGHSKWHSIKHKKGAADAKRGKLFAVLIRQIEVAARSGGGDPDVERDAAHDGAEGARQLACRSTRSSARSSAGPARKKASPTSRSRTRATRRAASR